MNDKFLVDYKMNTGKNFSKAGGFVRILKNHSLRYLFYGRITEYTHSKIILWICKIHLNRIKAKQGLEIDFSGKSIGKGLQLIHPFSITVNPSAKLGENVVLFKGCTIGSIRSGKRAGVPQIGNNVVICCNAFICGGISIGSNVLIAANSFVNFDVPDNSVVIGNPGVIKEKENPVEDYIK